MDDLDDAIAELQRAVARLETMPPPEPPPPNPLVSEIAATLAARVDAALARIGQVLAGEG